MGKALADLKSRATLVLELENKKLRNVLIDIAAKRNPSGVWVRAEEAAIAHKISFNQVIKLAEATRWLSVLRRDFGEEEFNQTIGT